MVHHIVTSEDQEIEAPYLKLYSANTGNGVKITILLELLGIDYYLRKIDFKKAEQKEPWYLKFNPNGKIPSLTSVDKAGKTNYVNESVAILTFIADKYDKERKFSYGTESPFYYQQLEWLLFQVSGIAPAKGQLGHFSNVAPEKNVYAINRFKDEVVRSFSVLEEQLKRNGTGYLVGDHISLADISTYPYVHYNYPPKLEEELKQFPLLSAWADKLAAVPEIVKAKEALK